MIVHLKKLIQNPILEKEVLGTGRTLKFFLFILGFILLACIPLLVQVTEMRDSGANGGFKLFEVIFWVQAACVALAIPAYSSTAIAGERQHRTFDLLRITVLQPWEIVWGKFVAVTSYIFVFLLAFLPLVAICFLYGGTDPVLVALSYGYLLAGAATAIMFCVMMSAGSHNPVKSILVGYVFMIAFAITWGVFVSELLLRQWTRFGAGVGNTWEVAYMLIVACAVLAFAWSLFYISSTSLLKPPSWNRSTPLRIWYAAFSMASLAFLVYAFAKLQGRGNIHELTPFLVALVGAPGVFAAIGFCGEPAQVHPRLLLKLKRISALWQPFVPGGLGSRFFVHGVVIASAAAAIAVSSALSDRSLADEAFWLAAGIFIFVNFCCSLSRTVRALWDTPRARVLTLLVIAGLMLLPLLTFLFEDRPDMPPLAWINPFVALTAYTEHHDGNSDLLGRQCYVWFYVVAAAATFLVRRIYQQRTAAAARLAAQQT